MKKIVYIIVAVSVLFSGCEDVVDIKTDTAAPQLVVDASLVWLKGTPGNEQKIKLSMSTNYFSNVIPTVSGASVVLRNSSGTAFDFIENPGTGEYVCSTFIPEINETYTLTIIYNGETLTATESLKPVAPISRVEQVLTPGIGDDEDIIEVRTFFTDPGNSTDYYLFRFQSSITAIPEFIAIDDEFFQGNEIFGLYFNQDLQPGDALEIKLYGISERYFNYMTILYNIAGSSGNPFATPPATLRGNVVNNTHPNNFVLGYFNVSEVDTRIYTVQ